MLYACICLTALYSALGPGPATLCNGSRLLAADSAINDQFGNTLVTDGAWMAIGAPAHEVQGVNGFDSGAVYMFLSTDSGWTERAQLTAPDASAADRFGSAVALSAGRVLVGAHWNDLEGKQGSNHGAAYIYHFDGDGWLLEQQLSAPDPQSGAWFGYSAALLPGRALIGAPGNANGVGAAYVLALTEQGWTTEATLTASDGKPGDRFGMFVILDGDRAIVSAGADDGPGGVDQGSVYIFERSGGAWHQTAKLTAPDAHAEDYFGSGAALVVGDQLLIPAIGAGGPGAVYVFQQEGGDWTLAQKLIPSQIPPGGSFGTSLAAAGNRLFIGAGQADLDQAFAAGAVVEFQKGPNGWTERRIIPNPEPRPLGGFGIRVALTHDGLLAVGALGNDGPPNASGVVYLLPTRTADCDGDGALAFADFLCFQNAFIAGQTAADCNTDGAFDLFDFLCFSNLFASGCP